MTEQEFWDRFFSRTRRAENGCLEWTGHVNKAGYARVKVWGESRNAHRVRWEKENGLTPDGFVIRHKCDNRKCVDIDHLISGRPAENSADMVDRGRSLKGSRHQGAKLTEADVVKIRSLRGAIGKYRLAKIFGVSTGLIGHIFQRRAWVHIP